MTGLITARVCADHFEHVVIIEADEGADTAFPATSKRQDIHGNTTLVSRRPRVAQTFELHCEYYSITFCLLDLDHHSVPTIRPLGFTSLNPRL